MVHTYTDIVVVIVVIHTFAGGHRRPADGRERRTMAVETGMEEGQTASKTETAYVGLLSRVPLVGEGPRKMAKKLRELRFLKRSRRKIA